MENKVDKPYGYELILDLHGCDSSKFTRKDIELFFRQLCKQIDMIRCDLHFWDDEGVTPDEQQISPHTKGTSAVQFILTSSIVVHTLELLDAVYINIFSCKKFNRESATQFTIEWFQASRFNSHFIERL